MRVGCWLGGGVLVGKSIGKFWHTVKEGDDGTDLETCPIAGFGRRERRTCLRKRVQIEILVR
jgi:hypothetical protein